MACCTGTAVDLKEMRTPGQKEMGNILGPLLQAGISHGATPFGGQLSMGPDQAQMAAMNMMMGIGGQGGYQPGRYPTMAPGSGPPGPMSGYSSPPPWNPSPGFLNPPPGDEFLGDSTEPYIDPYSDIRPRDIGPRRRE